MDAEEGAEGAAGATFESKAGRELPVSKSGEAAARRGCRVAGRRMSLLVFFIDCESDIL